MNKCRRCPPPLTDDADRCHVCDRAYLVVSTVPIRRDLGAGDDYRPVYVGSEPKALAHDPKPQPRCPQCQEPALSADGACLVHAGHYPQPLRPGDGPSASAGMVGGNVRGVTTAGTRPPGAAGWEYRPPHPQHHDHADLPIVLNGRLAYQQRPPVHVPGSAPGSAKDTRRQVRLVSEAEAQRIALREAARGLARDIRPPKRTRLGAVYGYGRSGRGTR
jgi:hypothetical protein